MVCYGERKYGKHGIRLVFEKIDLEDLSSTLELRQLSTDHLTMLLKFHSNYLKIREDKARAVYR